MLQAMYNGVSALQANQQEMDIIGNNIANVSTTAFKSSDVEFADQLSQTLQGATPSTATKGGTNPVETGSGVTIGSIETQESQGGLLQTSSPTDMAIQGNGYFMVSNPPQEGVSYTRDGHFALDSSGDLVDAATGQYVLGWSANSSGTIDTTQPVSSNSKLQIQVGVATAVKGTSAVTMSGNLDAATASGGSITQTVNTYDSEGTSHDVTLTFSPVYASGVPTNVWDWTASGTGVTTPSGTVNQGTITFNSDGNETAQTGSLSLANADGATTPQAMTLNFVPMTQDATNSTVNYTQDGFPAGTLQSYTVNDLGIITGQFSNGLTQSLGQVALATFANPQGLASTGSNEYTTTPNSGAAQIGAASTIGIGSISSGYLEQSNVDLGSEFSQMIVAQNAYEANTKIVSTVNTMLQTLNQMVPG